MQNFYKMNYPLYKNFNNICRTCLLENVSVKSLFSCDQIMGQDILLSDMLMSCASVLVLNGDGLPATVCLNCCQQLNAAYSFRKLCERSEATLREHSGVLDINQHIFSSHLVNESRKSQQITENINSDTATETEQNYSKTSVSEDNEIIVEKDNLCLESIHFEDLADGKKVFICNECNKQFSTETSLDRHKSIHKNNSKATENRRNKSGIIRKRNQPRTCEVCNKTFKFHSNLERHKLIHTGEKPYLCNICGKTFAQMAYLKIHSFIHTGEKPYKCQMCQRGFAAPGTLITHVRTHTGERPHICKICGKDFPQAGYLSAHIRTHTGEKPIECKVCNRRFNQSSRLNIHMRIHSGEKPYQCTMCGRSFAVKSTLKKHIRTHTGERPYRCQVCGLTFAQNGTLNTHLKTHNKDNENNEKMMSWQ